MLILFMTCETVTHYYLLNIIVSSILKQILMNILKCIFQTLM